MSRSFLDIVGWVGTLENVGHGLEFPFLVKLPVGTRMHHTGSTTAGRFGEVMKIDGIHLIGNQTFP